MIIQDNDPTTQASFSFANRIFRTVWLVVYVLFFQFSPRFAHGWRAFLLKLFGAKLGKHVHIYPKVEIWAPWNLTVGNHVGIADGVRLYNIQSINIGEYAVVSQGAYLCTGSHDIDSANFQLIAKAIKVDPYAWVCAESFIGPGVHLSEGVVTAARAVVTKSILDEWSVWAGNPAVRKRGRSAAIKLSKSQH